jgi:type IV pilus assembly protein PilM
VSTGAADDTPDTGKDGAKEGTRVANAVVGLDVGSNAVRALELRPGRRGGPLLRRSGQVPLPPGAVEAGLVRDQAAVTAALRQLWSEVKFSTRTVRLGVGSGSVLVRHLELDWMPPEDLRRSLRYQVADLLPVPIDDANVDHVLVGEGSAVDDDGRVRRLAHILLVATAREAVDGLVRCAQAARLRPVVADLGAFASIRTATAWAPRADPGGADAASGQTQGIIDIGSDTVTVAVHTGGRPRFVRVAPGAGSAMVTRTLVEQTGCSWEEAERLKRTPGVLPAPGSQPRDHTGTILLEATTRMLSEIRATLDFQASSDPGAAPHRFLLSGHGSLQPGLLAHCTAAFQTPVDLLQPAEGTVSTSGAEPPGPDLVVSYGLCLGSAA